MTTPWVTSNYVIFCIFYVTYKFICMINTDDVIIGMFHHVLLAASGLMYYWVNAYWTKVCIYCMSIWMLYKYRSICVLAYIILYHYTPKCKNRPIQRCRYCGRMHEPFRSLAFGKKDTIVVAITILRGCAEATAD